MFRKLSPILDVAGLGLIVVAAGMVLGVAASLAVAGVCCLVVSWSMTRPPR